jgi:long-chain acyl-CoA synthetase
MTDPLAVLPLAIAAGGGSIDDTPALRLIAAGVALLQRHAAVARALRGRRAAILLPTDASYLTALAASEGRAAVLVNPLAAPPEIAYQIGDANVGAVFTNAALAERAPSTVLRVLLDDAPRTARLVAPDGTTTDVPLTSPFALDLAGDTATPGLDEEAAVVYTSALAGRPLGAILTHANLLSNARATIEMAGLVASDHSLAVLPFAHLFGLVVAAVAPLLTGARVTTMPRFNPLRAAELLTDGDVSVFVGVPSVFAGVLAALERRGPALGGRAIGALRLCICGGAPLRAELQERWAVATGVELRQGYGLTEAGPVCLFNRADRPNRRGTLGVPFPDVEVTLRAIGGGREVPAGDEGEICVRGPNVSPGYVGRPSALPNDAWSAGLPRRDGWLRTGDIGAVGSDGTIAFRGVVKPMFTRNGFNIYPREIEQVVGELPGVQGVRVRAVPEPAKENDIALDVVAIGVTEDDVRAWCAARLSAYKQPSAITLTSP